MIFDKCDMGTSFSSKIPQKGMYIFVVVFLFCFWQQMKLEWREYIFVFWEILVVRTLAGNSTNIRIPSVKVFKSITPWGARSIILMIMQSGITLLGALHSLRIIRGAGIGEKYEFEKYCVNK